MLVDDPNSASGKSVAIDTLDWPPSALAVIEHYRTALKEIHEYADTACEGAGEPEFSGFSWIAACSHKALNT